MSMTQSFLKPVHQQRILAAYQAFADDPGFATVATNVEVLEKDGNLSIPRYVRPTGHGSSGSGGGVKSAWMAFDARGRDFWRQMDALLDMLDNVVSGKALDG